MSQHKIEAFEIVKGAFSKPVLEYDIVKHLGDGTYGVVQLIKCPNFMVDSSKLLAMKYFKRGVDTFKYELNRFRTIQHSINHAFLNQAYGYSLSKDDECILYLEYIDGGTLYNVINHFPRELVTPYVLGFCLAEISEGLSMIHGIGLIHQDLHMENVLVRSNGHLVISDFGLAFSLLSAYTPRHKEIHGGKSQHYAPELRKVDQKFICHSVDYYALGVLVYIIATTHNPADPLLMDYRKQKDFMFNEVHPTMRQCLKRLLDPSKHTRLCNDRDGNISLLLTNDMRSTIWNVLGNNLGVLQIKQKIRELALPSPFAVKK